MTREDNAAFRQGADGGVEVGLGPVFVRHPSAGHAEFAKLRLDILDQGEVGAARGGVEGHQLGEDVEAAQGQGFGVDHGQT